MKYRNCAILCLVGLLSAGSGTLARRPAESVHKPSLLAMSERIEERYRRLDLLASDSAMTRYIQDVLNRLVLPEERLQVGLRAFVLRDDVVNAFATPHGAIYLCTGILARLENEGQLAALLAHEMTHVMKDHAARNLENRKLMARRSANAQIGMEFFFGGLSGAVTNSVFRAAVTGYSRDLEREADSVGLARLRNAGYPELEFRNLFLVLKKYIEEQDIKKPYFFSTHPRITERIENYYAMAGRDTTQMVPSDSAHQAFLLKLEPAGRADARMNLVAGKLDLAERDVLRYLALDSCNVSFLLMEGDICRFRVAEGKNAGAMEWYRKGYACEGAGGQAARRLGLLHFSQHEFRQARPFLKEWVQHNASAPDVPLIMEYLERCQE